MSFLGNIIWFFVCGLWQAIAWAIVGLFWSITIIGLPVGFQCFKMAGLYLAPFGKEVVVSNRSSSLLLNILWIIFGGWELALLNVSFGLVLMITIIGIPFGRQCFKLAGLSLLPFGAEVI